MLGRIGAFVCSSVSAIKEKAVNSAKAVKKAGATLVAKISGRDTFQKAEQLMAEVRQSYEEAENKYKQFVAEKEAELKDLLDSINKYKLSVYQGEFIRFKRCVDQVHNLTIEGTPVIDFFDQDLTKVENQTRVRSNSDIYLIDFNNLKFSERFWGIFSVGFSTRKKAKQTLIRAEEESKRVEEEIKKFDAQRTKLNVVIKSTKNVAIYFESMIKLYGQLLNRFEFAIRTQRIQAVRKSLDICDTVDFRLLPLRDINDFKVLFDLSLVLKEMCKRVYFSNQGEINENEIVEVGQWCQQIEELALAA